MNKEFRLFVSAMSEALGISVKELAAGFAAYMNDNGCEQPTLV